MAVEVKLKDRKTGETSSKFVTLTVPEIWKRIEGKIRQ